MYRVCKYVVSHDVILCYNLREMNKGRKGNLCI